MLAARRSIRAPCRTTPTRAASRRRRTIASTVAELAAALQPFASDAAAAAASTSRIARVVTGQSVPPEARAVAGGQRADEGSTRGAAAMAPTVGSVQASFPWAIR